MTLSTLTSCLRQMLDLPDVQVKYKGEHSDNLS